MILIDEFWLIMNQIVEDIKKSYPLIEDIEKLKKQSNLYNDRGTLKRLYKEYAKEIKDNPNYMNNEEILNKLVKTSRRFCLLDADLQRHINAEFEKQIIDKISEAIHIVATPIVTNFTPRLDRHFTYLTGLNIFQIDPNKLYNHKKEALKLLEDAENVNRLTLRMKYPRSRITKIFNNSNFDVLPIANHEHLYDYIICLFGEYRNDELSKNQLMLQNENPKLKQYKTYQCHVVDFKFLNTYLEAVKNKIRFHLDKEVVNMCRAKELIEIHKQDQDVINKALFMID